MAALLQDLERRAESIGTRREAHCNRLDGVDALAYAARPIQIAKRHTRRDELLACGGRILDLGVRDGALERFRLLLGADGGDVFVVEDAVRGTRRDERARQG